MSEQILREKDVLKKLSVSRVLFRYLLDSDQFPAPFDISGRGAIGWREAEVDEWIVKQSKAKRRAAVRVVEHSQSEQSLSMTDTVSLLSQPLIGSEN